MDLKELIKLAKGLDIQDKQQLIHFLQSETKGSVAPIRLVDEIQEQKHKEGLVCPHCHNRVVVRFGKYVIKTRAGAVKRQRYRCKTCLQTFNDLTNSPLQRTRRPHLWVRFIELMIEGFSLRKCAELMYEEVSYVTLFYWRHKILAALKQVPTEAFQGIVEMERPTSYTRKRAGGILSNASRVSAAVNLSTVISATTKSAYWSPETVRR